MRPHTMFNATAYDSFLSFTISLLEDIFNFITYFSEHVYECSANSPVRRVDVFEKEQIRTSTLKQKSPEQRSEFELMEPLSPIAPSRTMLFDTAKWQATQTVERRVSWKKQKNVSIEVRKT